MQCSIYFFTKNAVDFEATEMFYAKAKISYRASSSAAFYMRTNRI